jgi:nucleotidyltransferase substrate binding protein (TIGR01987 family)
MNDFPLSSFNKLGQALQRLEEVLSDIDNNPPSYIQEALIQTFEFSIEYYWKTLKKILLYEEKECNTPRDVIINASQMNLIDKESLWHEMLKARNKMSHMYDKTEADEVFIKIQTIYFPILKNTYLSLEHTYHLQRSHK